MSATVTRIPCLLGMVTILVGCNSRPPDRVTAATSAPVAVATAFPTATPPTTTPTRRPTAPTAGTSAQRATATPASSGTQLVVRGTQGLGVLVRLEPGGQQRAFAKEGETVTDLGERRMVDGREWRRVRAADGNEGWSPSEYLARPGEAAPIDARPGGGSPFALAPPAAVVEVPTYIPTATPGASLVSRIRGTTSAAPTRASPTPMPSTLLPTVTAPTQAPTVTAAPTVAAASKPSASPSSTVPSATSKPSR